MSRLGAQSRRQIDDGAYRRVVHAILETDTTERRVALRQANAAAHVVPALCPFQCQMRDGVAHLDRQADRALWRVRTGQRVVEEDHHAVASEAIEGALVFANQWYYRTMILSEQRHDVFRLRGFGKGSEAPQVAKE